jgi:serine/threonine protein kinase
MKIHNECSYANSYITQFYGITKDQDTGEFLMVLEYAKDGNLREYLEINFPTLKWYKRLEILHNILDNLECIHSKKYIHKDLHSGNILHFDYYTKITDLGLAQSSSKHGLNSNVSGVLPYMAPEVLNGKPYTFASDIYSFGVIMIEISTGKPPYGNVPHNEKLALAICNGLRPRIAKGTPKCYIDLVNRCLDANPGKRPLLKEILEKIRSWRFYDDHEKLSSNNENIFREFINADNSDTDKIIPREIPSEATLHPGAIYTSRLMSFTNLSKPKNSKGIQIEDLEGTVYNGNYWSIIRNNGISINRYFSYRYR